MAKHIPTRIVELNQYRSKRAPRFGHVVATLFPCNHKKYLGIARMRDGDRQQRVSNVKIWTHNDYEVMDKMFCSPCRPEVLEFRELEYVSQLVDSEKGLDSDDDL